MVSPCASLLWEPREDGEPQGVLSATMVSYRAMEERQCGRSGQRTPPASLPITSPRPWPCPVHTGFSGSCSGNGIKTGESDHEEAAGL